MLDRVEREKSKSDLILPWLAVIVMFAMLVAYIVVCHIFGEQLQQSLPQNQRELIRTILYAVAIITFPLTNLIRHIQVRLNQTMPGDDPSKNRYLLTVIVSMALVESVGIFGFVMFMLGDDFNTLYIFTGLSALGMFLYRPKPDEYSAIIEERNARKHQ
ncbi:hypothetical protein V2P20_18720 [Methylobacter sp. Wu1]|jgi:RsiW-degrading membrane proteinase PrsW (M82 family)|uniref:hypothetical protein n=1 Tax=Methylobacter sp. Wu1 TaxID=3119359 RepID=UPI002F947001